MSTSLLIFISLSQADETADMTEEEKAIYQKYKPKTVDELKDFMRWNGQQVTGTKVTSPSSL
jgi:hypothetical protein